MVEKSRQFDRRCFMIRTGKVNYFFISGRRECAFFLFNDGLLFVFATRKEYV